MTARVRLTTQAECDVLDIWLRVAEEDVAAADKLVDELYPDLSKIGRVSECRNSYGTVPAKPSLFLTAWLSDIFSPVDDGIEVYRVLHGARQIDDLL
jgi:toxin ParE1/3/4